MSRRWSECRQAARQGQLSHADLQQLLETQAAAGHWSRIQRWLPALVRHAVNAGERQGSAIALAAWCLRQRRSALALQLLAHVHWPEADAHAWLLRGQAAANAGDDTAAERHLIRAITLTGGQASAAYRLGQLHRSRGQFDQAATWFLASLSNDPDPFHIHNELQFTRCSDALLPDLVAFYAALCRRQPQRALAGQLHAHYLIKQGKQSQAIAESRRAARLDVGSLESWLAPATAAPTPPDFLILGTPKGGTTAVLRWLEQVPGLWCHPRKELHFFDGRYAYGEAWYCAQFPRFQADAGILRGEATPNYFSDPSTPQRVANLIPQARLVVLLRDPVRRAVSWVQHLQRLEGLEGSVSHWLEQELHQLEGLNPEQLAAQPRIGTGALQDSCYDLHWARWAQALPDNPPLMLSSDQLFRTPEPVLTELLRHLGLKLEAKPWLQHWQPRNVNPSAPASLSPQLRQRLAAFLARHSQQTLTRAKTPGATRHQPRWLIRKVHTWLL